MVVSLGVGNQVQNSCLENSAHRGASKATVQGVAESDATVQLSMHEDSVNVQRVLEGTGHVISPQ